MKKIRTLIVAILCAALVMACACGSSSQTTYATDKGISVAQQAVDAIDGYLDGRTDGSAAKAKLKNLKSEMDYVDDLPNETTDEEKQYAADWSIRTSIGTASTRITLDSSGGDNETYDSLVSTRNRIAEEAGLEVR